MIKIKDKIDCCGCTACVERCPRSCITMQCDEEGFLYPHVFEQDCIGCGLCEKACPNLSENTSTPPLKVFAAYSKDEQIRKVSSSGGVFTVLAETVINEGGVVFGARFDSEWNVIHSYTETIEGLAAFRGSKYVQSIIGNSYKDAELFLKQGRKVLFSGTPCQISGLKHFLRKQYENLLTIDVICHGVPSPLVWKKYVESMRPKGALCENSVLSLKEKSVLTGLSFRDKRAGWRKYGFSVWAGATKGSDENTVFPPKHSKKIIYEIGQENVFLRGFLQNLYLRPSCHNCRFRNYKSGSDFTLADFWGVERVCGDWNDDKGMSLIIVKTQKAKEFLDEIKINSRLINEHDYEKAFKGNSSLFKDDEPNPSRNAFFRELNSNPKQVVDTIVKYTMYSSSARRRSLLDHSLMFLGLYRTVKLLVTFIRNVKR